MAINSVQFQKGMSLPVFLENYGTEELCSEALEKERWPEGYVCKKCSSKEHMMFVRKQTKIWQCKQCRHQGSLISGTIFQDSKLPLNLWFLGIYMLSQSKTNLSALQLKRHLGVCYRTAWRMKQKIMAGMEAEEEDRRLEGTVQIDDAYFGGELVGGKRGRGSENKQPFVIALQTNEQNRPMYVSIDPVPGFTLAALTEWSQKRLKGSVDVYSDGLAAFTAVIDQGHAHTVIRCDTPREACEATNSRWVNTVLSNLKRAIDGTYHAFKFAKYAKRYCAEAAWRFNRRFDLWAIVGEMIHAMVSTVPWTEQRLRSIDKVSAETRH